MKATSGSISNPRTTAGEPSSFRPTFPEQLKAVS